MTIWWRMMSISLCRPRSKLFCGIFIFLVLIEKSGAIDDDDATPEERAAAQRPVTIRRTAKMDGDIILGALFPVHRQPPLKVAFTRTCGEIWEQYGMHRIEVFLRTLERINANPNILPNITLGSDIRDSCWYPPVALEQSIDFIKNSIASVSKKMDKENNNEACQKSVDKPIAGLIGPGSSQVTIQVQNLLSLFNIPQLGYSATSKDLSDKSLYKYFMRVVPSDKLQARALVDIVQRYNWTYVSTVYTEGNYGWSGMQEFSTMAKDFGICEATSDKVPNNADDDAYDKVIENLKKTENAKVVVCFCEGMTVRGLLKATERRNARGQFLFIGSDGWAVRPDVVENIEEASLGGMSIKLSSPPIEDFDDHYFSLSPFNNTNNPWFREFWQEKFKCLLQGDDADQRFKGRNCTGEEDLRQDYVQDAKLGFVINAIYTMAYALHNMHQDVCGNRPGLCEKMIPINGSIFLEHLMNVSFRSYSDDNIEFNENGDPPGRYEVMNFQLIKTPNGSYYDYECIGSWDSGNLTMVDDAKIFWPNPDGTKMTEPIESVCSKPCEKGKVKSYQPGGVHCCWACSPCDENAILLNESTCKACAQGWWPNENLNACVMIKIEHIQWGDTEAVVAMVFAFVGIFATTCVAAVFVRHNNTSIVKASTRELSYLILFGIMLSYITTFPLVAKPSQTTCYLARIVPGLSFSLIYGALVTKTNRIARILAGSKKKIMTRKPRFMSACAQVVITFMIIGVECTIITAMLILEPADSKLVYPEKQRVRLACNATTMGIIVPLGFDIFLIVMCTLYAIKTRNLPENFNEAKFIGFTMYTTCIIWLAFVPIYFGSENKVITMCMAVTLSASVALVLLFCPKIYIIICKPEKNQRSAFTTSKDVRCHIGSTAARSNDSADRNEKPFENAAFSVYRQRNFFNRWKTHSVRGSPQHGSKSSGAGASSLSSVLNRPIAVSSAGFRNPRINSSIPVNNRSTPADSIPSGPSSRFSHPTTSASKVTYHQRAGSGRHSQDKQLAKRVVSVEYSALPGDNKIPRAAPSVDSSVQTDDELLENIFTSGLRKRSSKSSISKHNGQLDFPKDELITVTDESENSFYDIQTSKCNSEADLLLEASKTCDSSSEGNFLQIEEHSPLLVGSEHSPLLDGDGQFACDSTSEETLSDRDEPSDDIDDLLSGIHVHDGSFASLFSSELVLPTLNSNIPAKHNKFTSSRRKLSVEHMTPSSSSRQSESSTSTCGGYQPLSPTSKGKANTDPFQNSSSYHSNQFTPPSQQRHLIALSSFGADGNIPDICIHNHQPDIRSHTPSCSSSGSSYNDPTSPKNIVCIDDRHLADTPAEALPTESSIDMSPVSQHEELALSDMIQKRSDFDSVTKFQRYLRTRGLELDLSTVQSSDV